MNQETAKKNLTKRTIFSNKEKPKRKSGNSSMSDVQPSSSGWNGIRIGVAVGKQDLPENTPIQRSPTALKSSRNTGSNIVTSTEANTSRKITRKSTQNRWFPQPPTLTGLSENETCKPKNKNQSGSQEVQNICSFQNNALRISRGSTNQRTSSGRNISQGLPILWIFFQWATIALLNSIRFSVS